MVTLADQVHLHADCFRCSICHDLIDGTKTFVRLQDDLAHPALADGLPAYAHPRCSPTIQLKTVPAQVDNKARRFQPTAGAAPPTQSTILTPSTGRPANPAAGIFSRISALSSANPALLAPVSGGKFGGMHTCAFCGLTVSSLEAVLGPRGTQWHRSCLICRAPPQKAAKEGLYEWRKPKPTVCGKRLDSGAKVNGDGEVRCRECYDRESGAFKVKV
uniref:LIM zinc-binding domain-containing protein n=1 Tax=Kalmanozyma brasiliensis (strain GHG001) TaxID=1365824 RepID=V5EAD1_KALBG